MKTWLLVLAGCGRIGFGPLVGGDGGPNDGRSGDALGDAIVVPDTPPGTLTANDIADTYLQGGSTNNFGNGILLQVGRSTGAGNNYYALLQFDISGLPAPPITKATLRLYQYAGNGSTAIAMEVRRELQAWDELSANWNDASTGVPWGGTATVGGNYSMNVYATLSVTPGVLGPYEWDVTALVNEWLTGTSPNFGLEVMHSVSPPTGDYASFASRETTMPIPGPQLLVMP